MNRYEAQGAPDRVYSDGIEPEPQPIRGWLLYICIMLTILRPPQLFRLIHGRAPIPKTFVIALLLCSLIAGILTWAKAQAAFVWLRICFGIQLLYGFFQVYWSLKTLNRPGLIHLRAAKYEALFATINILYAVLLFFYFRFSQRVRETFGRNI